METTKTFIINTFGSVNFLLCSLLCNLQINKYNLWFIYLCIDLLFLIRNLSGSPPTNPSDTIPVGSGAGFLTLQAAGSTVNLCNKAAIPAIDCIWPNLSPAINLKTDFENLKDGHIQAP